MRKDEFLQVLNVIFELEILFYFKVLRRDYSTHFTLMTFLIIR